MMHLAIPPVAARCCSRIGVYGVVVRRNAVLVLMGVELMLNAVNLNLVAFDVWWRDTLHAGQALTVFVITIAAAEIGVGLAIVLLVFRTRGTSTSTAATTWTETAGSAARLGDWPTGRSTPGPSPTRQIGAAEAAR